MDLMSENSQVPVSGKWKRYPSYKQSGVEWLGEIPEGWDAIRMKYLCDINPEALGETTDPDFEMRYVDISSVDPVKGIVETEIYTFENSPSRARRIVRDGDVIVSTVRTYLKAIAPIKNPGPNLIVSTGFAVIHPDQGLNSEFASYALTAPYSIEKIVALSEGVSYPAINASEIANIEIGIPKALTEQTAIATFLDRKIVRIDALIEKKERLIALLKEKRAALISHAVTKGLDPDAKMKDSGVDYFGAIPLGWETINLRNIVNSSAYGPRFSSDLYEEKGKIALLRTTDRYEEGNISYETLPLVQFSNEDFSRHFLKHDDLLITRSGTCGITSIFGEFYYPVLPGAFLIRFRLKPIVLPRFIKYYLNSQIGREILSSLESGCVQKNLNTITLFQMKLPFPPLLEQKNIVSYLDRESILFTVIKEKIHKSIDSLIEYRSALISAAVTGKIDIRQEVIV
jgi:type I restriction enzyme S subunit